MDTIKLMTIDGYGLTFIGRDSDAMLRHVKTIPGARFVGTIKKYGIRHTYNHWEVPYMCRDIEQRSGPFEALHGITTWHFTGEEHRLSLKQINELIDTRPPENNPMSAAYRAGRDGVPEPDWPDPALRREYEEGCRIRRETDVYRGAGPWRRNVTTGTYQLPLASGRILTVQSATMTQAICERMERESCSLDAAYRAELADVEKWRNLALVPSEVDIINAGEDEASIRYTIAPTIDGKVFRIDGPMQNLHWMIFDPMTGRELARGTDSSSTPTEAEAKAWQEKANRLVARWKGRLADLDKTLYICYGRIPPNGHSRNYANGTPEAGVSVYPAKYDLVTGAIIFDDNYGVWQGGTLVGVIFRTPYLVEGDYIADGSDGEPLLCDVRKIALLSYDQETGGFFIKRRYPQAKMEKL